MVEYASSGDKKRKLEREFSLSENIASQKDMSLSETNVNVVSTKKQRGNRWIITTLIDSDA